MKETTRAMIDQFALALGHGLLAVALLRLALRADVDADPLVETLKDELDTRRKATSAAGRRQARRAAQTAETRAGAAKRSRTQAAKRSRTQAAKR